MPSSQLRQRPEHSTLVEHMSVIELVMASANPHKVDEINELLQRLAPNIRVLPRPEWVQDVVEDADSLTGNARLKARALCTATGTAAVADDTGLFVEALDGRPGIYAARFAGENASYADNVNYLLSELRLVGALTPEARRAAFVTVALVSFPDGREVFAEGRVEGYISLQLMGSGGFGYDPVFVADELAPQTFAVAPSEAKQLISHRARAFTSLVALLV